MCQGRFSSQYLLHFHMVIWTFSILDLCDTIVKEGSVTVIRPFSGLFCDRANSLGDALGEQ